MRAPLPRALLLIPILVLVGCDHVTKQAAKLALQNHAPRKLVNQILEFRYHENTDVAFNLLRAVGENVRLPLLLVSGAVGVLVLAAILVRLRAHWMMNVALVLMLAGALGNYLDRVFRGYVVDFIHLSHWPVFNIADVYVTVGAALLAWATFRNSVRARHA